MAKQISQETFDNVVKENIEEFEMSPEEAIEDATSQFEAQGVNLANIVKDLSLYSSGGEGDGQPMTHPVVQAVEDLNKQLQEASVNTDAIQKTLASIKSECDIDLARRCLAGKHNAYPALLKACQTFKSDSKMLISVLNSFCSLCNGQPDLLDAEGVALFCSILTEAGDNAELTAVIIKLIKLTCIKHEGNRQTYVSNEIIMLLVSKLDVFKDSSAVVSQVCSMLRVLTFDDDIRVPFGKSHEHAKMIVTEGGALGKILNVCKDYANDPAILGELFTTLAKLVVRDEFCQEIMDLGGLKLMLTALEENIEQQTITRQALGVMKAVAGNDGAKRAIVANNGAELILSAMTQHQRQSAVCESGCAAIATIVLRNPSNCQRVMAAGGADVILKCMQLHPQEEMVQKQACMAIRNLVARTQEHGPAFLQLGAETLLQAVLQTYPSCKDESKAALRDLGCDVELICRWMGTGTAISA